MNETNQPAGRTGGFTTFLPRVVIPSLAVILGVTVVCGLLPETAAAAMSAIQNFIFEKFSWFYIISVSVFTFFLLLVACSRFGRIKLGDDDSEPEYSFFSWIAMLFAAGMGIGLMYFGVAEPLSHFNDPILLQFPVQQRIKYAQMYSIFHWGIHAWAIYAVVGLSLAYFAYRYKLPLALRSAVYPLLKDRINGKIGDLIDIFALCSTFFGLATTLGFGVVQLNAGLENLGIVAESNFTWQSVIVIVFIGAAVLSAISGIGKGVKILSQTNIVIAVLLMLFVLFLGPTVYLLSSFSEGLGFYLGRFLPLTFNTYAYEIDHQSWFTSWTIIFWAWWISWSPFVGLFIAKISKGRTIREFILAVLLLPSIFNALWMTIFGNGAIWADLHSANGALSALAGAPETLLFRFFEEMPLPTVTSLFALAIICVFFITSADSGIYVMNSIATGNHPRAPQWQKVFWGALLAVLSLALLKLGGLAALQTMTLVAALPFTVVMFLFCYSMGKAFVLDEKYHSLKLAGAPFNLSAADWRTRLRRILTVGKKEDVHDYLCNIVRPAFEEIAAELERNGVTASISESDTPFPHVLLTIPHGNLRDFQYGVKITRRKIGDALAAEENLPGIDSEKAYIPETFFPGTRTGYGIRHFSTAELIHDVIRQYERELHLYADPSCQLIVSSPETDPKR